MRINFKHPTVKDMPLGKLKPINDAFRERRIKRNKVLKKRKFIK